MPFQSNVWFLFNILWSALTFAARFGHTEVVKLLIEQNGIDLNTKTVYVFCLIFVLFTK